MWQKRAIALVILIVGTGIGWYVYSSQVDASRPFKLGLDFSGGTRLVYHAKLDAIKGSDVADSMASLRDTIERRVNLFGVSEAIVRTERGGTLAGSPEERLIVELPGVTDTQKAIDLIGQTPVLEFRMLKEGADKTATATSTVNELFEPAAITGKDLKSAELQFQGGAGSLTEPVVVLHFNAEGAKIFADLTKNNVGRTFGMFLDGVAISTPVIREAIPDGTAVISGSFTPAEAKELARNLNYGALPVPIELIGTETESSTQGKDAIAQDLWAGLWSVSVVILFMLLWYRLPGLVASLALLVYIAAMLFLFLVLPGPLQVTLTAAGIAAFILSIGMAVDANILIFERIKEERDGGKGLEEAIHDGFGRAWPSIRDSNISSMITAVILYSFGTAASVKGFGLVFFIGVLVSMLTAITISRTFLFALGINAKHGVMRFLFGSGLRS